MGISIDNPMTVEISFSKQGDEIVIEASAHFQFQATEYLGLSGRKGIPLTHNATQLDQIKAFAKNVWLPQIQASV